MKSNKGESRRSQSVRNIARGGALLGGALLAILLLVAWLDWNWGREIFSHICHQKGDRCLILGGTALPVCTRCFGIYLGIVLGCIGQLFLDLRSRLTSTALWAVAAGATFANGLDVLLELMRVYTNLLSLRFVQGLCLGAAVALFVLCRAITPSLPNQNGCSNRLPSEVSQG
ncbi:MAG: DUF2085 domain-containing protein [Verrucomicrobiota bacterium]|nr:DUF2085 domain-containing protein [Verrucomicrobiota bacterium]